MLDLQTLPVFDARLGKAETDVAATLVRQYISRVPLTDSAGNTGLWTSIDPEIIEAHAKEDGIDLATARARAEETVKFMAVRGAVDHVAKDGDFRIGMSGPVDRFWHCFLLYSPEYFAFCESMCGFYVQHRPNPPSMTTEETVDRLLNLIDVYEAAFGHAPDPAVWAITRQNVLARLDAVAA